MPLTLCLCVLHWSQNKERLSPCTTIRDRFCITEEFTARYALCPYIKQIWFVFKVWNTFVVNYYTYIGLFSYFQPFFRVQNKACQGSCFLDHWLLYYRYLIGINVWNLPVAWLLAALNSTSTKETRSGRDFYMRPQFRRVEKQYTA